MHISVRFITALIFSFLLVAMPGVAAALNSPAAPLGMVVQADRAQVGADLTAGGATIYDGDHLVTDGAGTLRARLGGPQLYLRSNTAAVVHGFANGFSADLSHGTVVLSSSQGQDFRVLADGAMIRPVGAQETLAQVTWVNAHELLLSSTRGAVEISLGDEARTIEAGSSYRVEVDPQPDPNPQVPVQAGRRHRLLFYIILGGIAAGTAVGIWRALVSPCGL